MERVFFLAAVLLSAVSVVSLPAAAAAAAVVPLSAASAGSSALLSDASSAAVVSLSAGEKDQNAVREDDASGFVLVTDVVPGVLLEIRYFSTFNFVGKRVDGYEEPVALITKEAAAALKKVSDSMMAKGYRLKIFDIYRPQMAVNHFERWALDIGDTLTKAFFYPELDKSVLFERGFIAHRSGHSRGSTVDLTLFDMKLGRDVDMGGPFDYFGNLSHPDFLSITEAQKANRKLLHDAMIEAGFKGITEEWWHFTLKKEPYPNTYFTFPSKTSSVKPTLSR